MWRSLEGFEAKGAISVAFEADKIVVRLKDEPEPLTLPRGREFVQACNNRDSPERLRLDEMLRRLWTPPRPQRPLADVVQLKPK